MPKQSANRTSKAVCNSTSTAASAFAGARASFRNSNSIKGVGSLTEVARVGAGIGADGRADLGWKNDDLGASAFGGVGGGVDVSGEINPVGAGKMAWRGGKWVAQHELSRSALARPELP
jgi:hypothetical protein